MRFVEKKGFKARARYSSLPAFKPKVTLRPSLPTTSPLQDHASSKPAGPLPADRVMATASIVPIAPSGPEVERMRPSLEAKARSLAFELGALPLPSPDPAPPIQLAARSVTFDMQKGERTIVFDDGATVTAPYDERKASDLTGLRPAR